MFVPFSRRFQLRRTSWWTRAIVVFTVWTAIGLSVSAQIYWRESAGGDGSTLAGAAAAIVPFYWTWALITPCVVMLTVRIAGLTSDVYRRLGLHIVAVPFVVILQSVMYAVAAWSMGAHAASWTSAAEKGILHHALGDAAAYACVVITWHTFDHYRRARDSELVASRLAVQAGELSTLLANARLDALRRQLDPHFLFNALNSLSTLVLRGDTAAAGTVIARIGDLLRLALASSDEQEIPLSKELEFSRMYLEIEQLRFGSRLTVVLDIEPDAEVMLVPRLVLQPLVENAVRYAVAPRPQGGRVTVSARVRELKVDLNVCDDGPGFSPANGEANVTAAAAGHGIGIANVRQRLALLYGAGASITTANPPAGGGLVTVTLPARPARAVGPLIV